MDSSHYDNLYGWKVPKARAVWVSNLLFWGTMALMMFGLL